VRSVTSQTGLLYHPLFRKHQTGWRHPEKSQRLGAIMNHLKAVGLLEQVRLIEPCAAPPAAVLRVHEPAYVEWVAAQSREGRLFQADADTVGSPATYETALLAAGAVLDAVDAVVSKALKNAFCAVRPPGHHAERDHAMGFCFFNNVAIGARHAQQRHGLQRIAIIDWDVHHGNGTQHAFEDDASVFVFSIHQFPLYPGSGRRDETGTGAGRGCTLNVPVAAGSTDTDYLRVFREELRPAIDRFRPELILISAGFDGHRDDPLAAMLLTAEGYATLTAEVLNMARSHCEGRIVSVLEGGYDLNALATSVAAHVRALMAER
jgi:acetoin utilization deacetylase AcuC-like enzyme